MTSVSSLLQKRGTASRPHTQSKRMLVIYSFSPSLGRGWVLIWGTFILFFKCATLQQISEFNHFCDIFFVPLEVLRYFLKLIELPVITIAYNSSFLQPFQLPPTCSLEEWALTTLGWLGQSPEFPQQTTSLASLSVITRYPLIMTSRRSMLEELPTPTCCKVRRTQSLEKAKWLVLHLEQY